MVNHYLFSPKKDGRVNFLFYNKKRTRKLYSSPITTIICLLRPSFLSQYHRRSLLRTSSKKTATTLNPKTSMDGVVEKEDLRLPSFLFFLLFYDDSCFSATSISRRCLLLLFFLRRSQVSAIFFIFCSSHYKVGEVAQTEAKVVEETSKWKFVAVPSHHPTSLLLLASVATAKGASKCVGKQKRPC